MKKGVIITSIVAILAIIIAITAYIFMFRGDNLALDSVTNHLKETSWNVSVDDPKLEGKVPKMMSASKNNTSIIYINAEVKIKEKDDSKAVTFDANYWQNYLKTMGFVADSSKTEKIDGVNVEFLKHKNFDLNMAIISQNKHVILINSDSKEHIIAAIKDMLYGNKDK